jgi:hypothetical protein
MSPDDLPDLVSCAKSTDHHHHHHQEFDVIYVSNSPPKKKSRRVESVFTFTAKSWRRGERLNARKGRSPDKVDKNKKN